MSTRRIVALLVLVMDAYFVFRGAQALGMLAPVGLLLGALVALVALGVLVFDLPLRRDSRQIKEPQRDDMSAVDRFVGGLGLVLFALAPFIIAARGVYRGVIPSLLFDQDVVFTRAPGTFVLNLIAFVALGMVIFLLFLKVIRIGK